MGGFTSKTESTSYTRQETRLILSAYNARRTDAALPTTTDMLSTEAGETRQPAESAPHALSNGQSTTPPSMDTDPGNTGVIATTRPAPSPPAVSTFTDDQAGQGIESPAGYQLDELESTSYALREVRETHHTIPSANDACQTDGALTTSDISSPQRFGASPARQPALPTLASLLLPQTQTPKNDHRPGTRKEADLRQLEQQLLSSAESTSYTPQEVRQTGRIFLSAKNACRTEAALLTTADMLSQTRAPAAPASVLPLPAGRRLMVRSPQQEKRRKLAEILRDYLETNEEPIVGSPDNPFPWADELGVKGASILSVFIEYEDMATYTCTFCGDIQTDFEASLTHQRNFLSDCMP